MLNFLPVWFVVPMLMAGALGTLWWLTRRAIKDSRLCRIVMIACSGRMLLAVFLYASSYWHWPIGRSLQLSQGFWSFGFDSQVYHHYGLQIAKAWSQGVEIPNPEFGIEYFVLVAAVYWILGGHPLYPIVLNGWLATLAGVLAYLIARRLFNRQVALWSVALISFWPSSWIWSSQILKDASSWCLIFAALWLSLVALTRGEGSGAWLSTARRAGLLVLLAASVVLTTRFRFYLGSSLLIAALLSLLPAGLFAVAKGRLHRGLRYLSVLSVIGLSILGARAMNPLAALSSPNPQQGHLRSALQHWQDGDLPGAEEEFHEALHLKEDPVARLRLAAFQTYQGKLSDAVATYTQHLEWNSAGATSSAGDLLGSVQFDYGDQELAAGRPTEAVQAYAKALTLAPRLQSEYASRATRFADQHRFALALWMLEHAQMVSAPDSMAPLTKLLARITRQQADAAFAAGRVAEAIDGYQEAIARDPSLTLIYGSDFGKIGQPDKFRRLTTALEQKLARPGSKRSLVGLTARVYLEHGDHELAAGRLEEAADAYRQVLNLVPSATLTHVKYALALAELKRFPEAIAGLEAFLATGYEVAKQPLIAGLLARLLIEQGDQELANGRLMEAVQGYDRALAVDASVQPLYAERGMAIAKLKHFSVATEMLQKLRTQPATTLVQSARPAPGVPPVERVAEHSSKMEIKTAALAIRAVSDLDLPLEPALGQMETGPGLLPAPPSKKSEAGAGQLVYQVVSEATPPSLDTLRHGFISAGGHSLTDPTVTIANVPGLLAYLPRGLAIGLFAPFPWQWFDAQGSTGIMRALASFEMLLMYLLLPGIMIGIMKLVRQRRMQGYFFLAAIGMLAIAMSLVVANLGTLFRLRLQFLLPLLIPAAAGARELFHRFTRSTRWRGWPRTTPLPRASQPDIRPEMLPTQRSAAEQ